MTTTIEISGWLEEQLERLVEIGLYSTKSEVVRDAIRRFLETLDMPALALKLYRVKGISLGLAAEIADKTYEEMITYMITKGVIPELGDAAEVILRKYVGVADRVLMPLPEKNLEYLPSALKALKRGGGTIHYQAFVRVGGRLNPLDAAKSGLEDRLEELGARYSLEFGRVIRSVGPRRYQVALDVSIRL